MPKVLITGAAGFIGYHMSLRCLQEGWKVTGFDNLNDYYDVRLKEARLARLTDHEGFRFVQASIEDRLAVEEVFDKGSFEFVVHLAAQAGVRYSLVNPRAYTQSNIEGFLNILEGCRHHRIRHLLYASSSSVYGANKNMPFSVRSNVDHPVSLYAATKKANELMAHSYAHLFQLPVTGLRFFTVYGPWGRPDMALFLFTRAILSGEPIQLFNEGRMVRDFTYIDDIVEGMFRLLPHIPVADPDWDPVHPDPSFSRAPYRLYNIGNSRPVELRYFVHTLEEALGRKALVQPMPMQPGDVEETFADVQQLMDEVGFRPDTPIETGVRRFVEWYRAYYRV
jgi:UDP-glucuronate 4-epimerase